MLCRWPHRGVALWAASVYPLENMPIVENNYHLQCEVYKKCYMVAGCGGTLDELHHHNRHHYRNSHRHIRPHRPPAIPLAPRHRLHDRGTPPKRNPPRHRHIPPTYHFIGDATVATLARAVDNAEPAALALQPRANTACAKPPPATSSAAGPWAAQWHNE